MKNINASSFLFLHSSNNCMNQSIVQEKNLILLLSCPPFIFPIFLAHHAFFGQNDRGLFCSDIQLQVGLPTSLMRYAFEIEKESIGSLSLSSFCFSAALNQQTFNLLPSPQLARPCQPMRRRRVFCVCQTLRYDSPAAGIHTSMSIFFIWSTKGPSI